MPVIIDESGGTDVGGGGLPEETAPYRYLGGEPTVHAFTPEKVENATRFEYEAEESGVVYSLVVSGEALHNPGVIATVAGQLAHTWNVNATVPGVTDIAETQEVRPLGGLVDVVQVAVTSNSGRTTGIVTLGVDEIRPDVFAQRIKGERATLNAFETGG